MKLADTQSELEELKKKYEALEHEVENLRKAKGKKNYIAKLSISIMSKFKPNSMNY